MSTDNSSNTAESPETISGQSETPTTQELSLRDALAAALNEHSDTPEEPVADVATDVQVEAETQAEIPVAETQEAPAHWPAEKREAFAKMPSEAQRFVLERHKEMEADYTRKTTDLAEQRKPLDEFQKLFDPYRQQLELSGMSPAQATQRLLAAQRILESNPLEGIKWLAQSYKVDLGTLVPKDDEFKDPAVKALEDQVSGLRNQLSQRDAQVQRENAAAIQKTLADFSEAKTAEGTPKHPHFKALENLMAPLVAQGKSLEEAYETASYTLPEVRSRIADEARKAAQAETLKQQEESRKAKLKEAKGATQIIRSRGTAVEESGKPMTLRQELERNLRAQQSGRV